MEKTLLIAMPLRGDLRKTQYVPDVPSLAVSARPSHYPIIPFLEKNLTRNDNLKVVMLTKKHGLDNTEENVKLFRSELDEALSETCGGIEYIRIDSEYSARVKVFEKLFRDIISNINDSASLIADITAGSKDTTMVILTALDFAARHLNADILNIIYGLGVWNAENNLAEVKICDISPLVSTVNLIDKLNTDSPDKARAVLNALIAE